MLAYKLTSVFTCTIARTNTYPWANSSIQKDRSIYAYAWFYLSILLLNLILKKTQQNKWQHNNKTTKKLPSDLFLVLLSCSCTHLWALPIVSWPGHGARSNSGLAGWGHFLYRQVQCYQHISTGRVAESSSSCGFSGNTKGITKGSKSLLSARECNRKQKTLSELVKLCFSQKVGSSLEVSVNSTTQREVAGPLA